MSQQTTVLSPHNYKFNPPLLISTTLHPIRIRPPPQAPLPPSVAPRPPPFVSPIPISPVPVTAPAPASIPVSTPSNFGPFPNPQRIQSPLPVPQPSTTAPLKRLRVINNLVLPMKTNKVQTSPIKILQINEEQQERLYSSRDSSLVNSRDSVMSSNKMSSKKSSRKNRMGQKNVVEGSYKINVPTFKPPDPKQPVSYKIVVQQQTKVEPINLHRKQPEPNPIVNQGQNKQEKPSKLNPPFSAPKLIDFFEDSQLVSQDIYQSLVKIQPTPAPKHSAQQGIKRRRIFEAIKELVEQQDNKIQFQPQVIEVKKVERPRLIVQQHPTQSTLKLHQMQCHSHLHCQVCRYLEKVHKAEGHNVTECQFCQLQWLEHRGTHLDNCADCNQYLSNHVNREGHQYPCDFCRLNIPASKLLRLRARQLFIAEYNQGSDKEPTKVKDWQVATERLSSAVQQYYERETGRHASNIEVDRCFYEMARQMDASGFEIDLEQLVSTLVAEGEIGVK